MSMISSFLFSTEKYETLIQIRGLCITFNKEFKYNCLSIYDETEICVGMYTFQCNLIRILKFVTFALISRQHRQLQL